MRKRLKTVLPLTLFLIVLLLYRNTRSTAKTIIILLAVPFSAVGAIWLLNLLGYNMSIGVWVGLIALMGVDAETGVFMLLYLDLAFEERRQAGLMRTHADLREAIVHGAVKRIRPKFMTVATMFVGLAPIMWSHGTGADVMKRIAAPMIGGIFTSFFLGAGAVWRAQGFQFRIATSHHGGQIQPTVASGGNEERANSVSGDYDRRLGDGPLGGERS